MSALLSAQERKQRIAMRCASKLAKAQAFNEALRGIDTALETENDAVAVLHVVANKLARVSKNFPSSDISETVDWIDELADNIQYRYEP